MSHGKDNLPLEEDPWEGYDPSAPDPEPVTEEEVNKAIEKLTQPKPRAPYLSYITLPLAAIWSLCHLYGLYVMIGTPLQAAIGLIVAVNLLFMAHYLWLLIVNIGRHRHDNR